MTESLHGPPGLDECGSCHQPQAAPARTHPGALGDLDMIMTGTPHGVHFVSGGDEVVCEIEAVGRLVNFVKAV